MAMNNTSRRSLIAIVGAAAAAMLMQLTPSMEGRSLTTYKDIAGVLTYCDGATENAMWGASYTPAQCDAQLDRDLARHAEGVMACTHGPLTVGQKVSYTDLAYNIGVTNYCESTVARLANAGDLQGSCDAIPMWSCITVGVGKGDTSGVCKSRYTNKKFVRGLNNRRVVERNICLKVIQ